MNITEFAKAAGVSKSAVSRYFNDGYVSEEKRRLIEAAIEATGYAPSVQAQNVRTRVTKLVGVIIPKLSSESCAREVEGISQVLSEQGYQLLLVNSANDPYKGYQHSRRELSGVKIQQQLHGVAEDDCRCGRAFAGSPQIVQCECQHVQYEACCISEQHRSKQHACGKETILRGRGSKASGCEDELLIKIKILKQKSGAFMQMNSPDFLWQRLSNARIMRCI